MRNPFKSRPIDLSWTPEERAEYVRNMTTCNVRHPHTQAYCTLKGTDHAWHNDGKGMMWAGKDKEHVVEKYPNVAEEPPLLPMRLRVMELPSDQYAMVIDRVSNSTGKELLDSLKDVGKHFQSASDGTCIGILIVCAELELG